MIRCLFPAGLLLLAACGPADAPTTDERDDVVSQDSVEEVYGADQVADEPLDAASLEAEEAE